MSKPWELAVRNQNALQDIGMHSKPWDYTVSNGNVQCTVSHGITLSAMGMFNAQ